ncbi:MAG: hypothetical protein IJ892_10245 [Prevotella sp.]|nr:hypothetical protein [Prevotella sp.]
MALTFSKKSTPFSKKSTPNFQKSNPGFMSSCTAEKTLKASGIFKKTLPSFHPYLFCVDNEGVWIRSKNWLAAAAAIIVPARCHDWQRPLPIIGAAAPNPNGMAFFPAPPRLFPICSGQNTLKGHSKSKGQQEQPKQRMKRMTFQRRMTTDYADLFLTTNETNCTNDI